MASTPTANAARLARNKKIVFTDAVEMYKNHEEGTITGTGVGTATQGPRKIVTSIVGK